MSKVALEIRCAPKNGGGLRLFDLNNKDKALKIQWVKTYNENEEIRTLANQSLKYKDEFFWSANLNEKDITKLVKDCFWLDVAIGWSELTYHEPCNKKQILQQPIWLNSNIKDKCENVLYNAQAIELNVTLISHVVKEDGNMISYTQLWNLCDGAINIVDYFVVCESINMRWKRILRSDIDEGLPRSFWINEILGSEHISSKIYRHLIIKENITNNKKNKWEQ